LRHNVHSHRSMRLLLPDDDHDLSEYGIPEIYPNRNLSEYSAPPCPRGTTVVKHAGRLCLTSMGHWLIHLCNFIVRWTSWTEDHYLNSVFIYPGRFK
jgi:hypothetical protein